MGLGLHLILLEHKVVEMVKSKWGKILNEENHFVKTNLFD